MSELLQRPLLRVLFLIGLSAPACLISPTDAAEPLPEHIPLRMVASRELIAEAAAALDRETDLHKRYGATTHLLYYLYLFPHEELSPLIAVLERDAPKVHDESLLSSTRGTLIHFSPDLALKLCRNVQDERMRDHWLGELVVTVSKSDPGRARRIFEEVKDPAARVTTVLELAESGKADFDETKTALADPAGFGWRGYGSSGRAFIYGNTLAWFTTDHYDEVVGFVRSQLQAEDAVRALCQMAAVCRSQHDKPELAARLMAAAKELVANCPKPMQAATTLLNYGYAQHDRQRAMELVDTYWRSPSEPLEAHQLLIGTDPATALANAEQIAERYHFDSAKMLLAALSRIASVRGPSATLNWLQDAAPSPLRDSAVGAIAAALSTYATNHRVKGAMVQEWVDLLSEYALQIDDRKLRWIACNAIHELAEYHAALMPGSIEQERAKLASVLEPNFVQFERQRYLGLLSFDKQRAEIKKQWQHRDDNTIDRIRATAAIVRDSTLSLDEKREWFDKLLEEVRKIPDLKERAAGLSGLGMALSSFDHERSLSVLYEELCLARKIGLKGEYHDVGDSLGTVFPLATAEETLGFSCLGINGNLDDVVKARWAFAHQLEDAEDRDVFLESLGNVLIRRQQYQRAAGIVPLMQSAVRQAKASAAIAAAQSGKTRND
jgi:hypothetical protein